MQGRGRRREECGKWVRRIGNKEEVRGKGDKGSVSLPEKGEKERLNGERKGHKKEMRKSHRLNIENVLCLKIFGPEN